MARYTKKLDVKGVLSFDEGVVYETKKVGKEELEDLNRKLENDELLQVISKRESEIEQLKNGNIDLMTAMTESYEEQRIDINTLLVAIAESYDEIITLQNRIEILEGNK